MACRSSFKLIFFFFWSYWHVPLFVRTLFCFLAQHNGPLVFFYTPALRSVFCLRRTANTLNGKWCLNMNMFVAFGVSLLTELDREKLTHTCIYICIQTYTHTFTSIFLYTWLYIKSHEFPPVYPSPTSQHRVHSEIFLFHAWNIHTFPFPYFLKNEKLSLCWIFDLFDQPCMYSVNLTTTPSLRSPPYLVLTPGMPLEESVPNQFGLWHLPPVCPSYFNWIPSSSHFGSDTINLFTLTGVDALLILLHLQNSVLSCLPMQKPCFALSGLC